MRPMLVLIIVAVLLAMDSSATTEPVRSDSIRFVSMPIDLAPDELRDKRNAQWFAQSVKLFIEKKEEPSDEYRIAIEPAGRAIVTLSLELSYRGRIVRELREVELGGVHHNELLVFTLTLDEPVPSYELIVPEDEKAAFSRWEVMTVTGISASTK